MKGHDPLIAMRMGGAAPSTVYVETDECPGHLPIDWRSVCPQFATVWIGDDEALSRLDLRFLKALSVHVSGLDPERVSAIAAAAEASGAARVVAVVVSPPGPHQALLSVGDTAGVLTWRTENAVAC